jgi:hypothetical protein
MVVGPGNGDITGGMVSSTLIVCVAVAVLPHRSVAVQVRVMLYSFGHEPLTVTFAKVNIGIPQLSVAVGVAHDGVPLFLEGKLGAARVLATGRKKATLARSPSPYIKRGRGIPIPMLCA